MSGQPPLWERMREANETINTAAAVLNAEIPYLQDTRRWLWKYAFELEAAESDAIAELARDLATSAGYANPDANARQRAADLYAMGYRKGGAS